MVSGGHTSSTRGEDDYDPLLILLRSAASHAARPVLCDYVQSTVIPSLADYFHDDDCARERAALVLSLLLGITVLGPMLGVEPLEIPLSADALAPPNPRIELILSAMLQAAADAAPAAHEQDADKAGRATL
ncbi:TetR/AcrR family transcriptional regulator [Streptomyces bullii]